MTLPESKTRYGGGTGGWDLPPVQLESMKHCDFAPAGQVAFARPAPTPEGVQNLIAVCQRKFGRRLSAEEAYEALNIVMGILYYIHLARVQCSSTPSTPESPTTIRS